MKRVGLLIALLLVSGCAKGVSDEAYKGPIKIADATMVTSCNLVSDIHGSSPFYGVFAGPALSQARRAALLEAEKLGASHVVWTATQMPYGGTSIHGLAYRCG